MRGTFGSSYHESYIYIYINVVYWSLHGGTPIYGRSHVA